MLGVVLWVAMASPTDCQLAVFDVEAGEGVSAERAAALGDVITAAVSDAVPECHVLARAELRAMVSVETERQLGGCNVDSCLAEVGEALGVERAVMGSVAVVDESLVISLRLVDLSAARVDARASDSTRGDAVAFTRWLASKLMKGEAAGARPAEPATQDAPQSIWRTLAWTGIGVSAGALVVSGVLGGATLGVAAGSTSLKSSRGTAVRDVDSLDAVGPWLAGGSNVALYVAAGAVIVGGALFFAPATEEVP
jgi:TolB-like protein